MTEATIRRIWKCAHCKIQSRWSAGWNWLTNGKPIETLDSFDAFCSTKCREASPKRVPARTESA